jgi:hypothetical protein
VHKEGFVPVTRIILDYQHVIWRTMVHGSKCDIDLQAGAEVMSKEQKSNKEARKKPAMTAKEKKAAKKAKKNERGRMGA